MSHLSNKTQEITITPNVPPTSSQKPSTSSPHVSSSTNSRLTPAALPQSEAALRAWAIEKEHVRPGEDGTLNLGGGDSQNTFAGWRLPRVGDETQPPPALAKKEQDISEHGGEIHHHQHAVPELLGGQDEEDKVRSGSAADDKRVEKKRHEGILGRIFHGK